MSYNRCELILDNRIVKRVEYLCIFRNVIYRVFNARFFDLYFTYSSNEFIAIDNKMKEFINIINQNSDFELIEKKYLEVLSLFDNFIQKFSLETLEYYLGDIDTLGDSLMGSLS